MRRAVISDIHGNLEAFREVLADIEAQAPDAVVSLGDNVGYGPDPEGVIELIREREIPSVLGNHEHGLINPNRRSWFNFMARKALKVTEDMLSSESLDYIASLPMKIVEDGRHFVHGFPPDSAHTYLFAQDEYELIKVFRTLPSEMFFVGHTHLLELVEFYGGTCDRFEIWEGAREIEAGRRAMVNAGSVGQPRDHDPHAKYVIWDDETRTLEVRFVEYDVMKTADKIVELGIPETYATRLYR
jgi:predicted phosphodiesterase